MRIAVISDVHGNRVALDAVLADLDRRSPDQVVVGGDVPFGPRPAETLDRLDELGYPIVMGNTDLAIVRAYGSGTWDGVGPMPAEAAAIASWCATRLRAPQVARLEALPAAWRWEPGPGGALLVVHATPSSLFDVVPADAPDERFRQMLHDGGDPAALAYGHIHVAFQRRVDRRLVVNAGSVGMPFDGDPRASYAIFTWSEGWSVEMQRVPFDVEAAVRDLHDAGLPAAASWEARLRKARPA